MKWVKESDANTKLYHRVVNGSQRRNEIKKFEFGGGGGRVEQDKESIKQLYTKKEVSTPFIEGLD